MFNLKGAGLINKYAPDVAQQNDLLRTVLQRDAKQPLKIIVAGKERYFSVDYRPVNNDGVNIGEVLTLSDITSFQETDISRTNLLAAISYELKTPVTAIKTSVGKIVDGRSGHLNNEQKLQLNNIEENTDRLMHIANELLNMTQNKTENIKHNEQ